VNFTPTNTGDDKFKLHFQGSVVDLVFVPAENRFHTKTESFLNIQRLAGGQNQTGDYWQVITPNGTRYRFGYQSQSELMCNGQNHVAHWNLDQVEDIHGNKIFYTYTESDGTAYVAKIEYNTDKARVIDLTDTPNPYNRQAYLQGCGVIESSRLSTIQVKANTTLIRQYDLAFSQAANEQPLLQAITEKGSNGAALPATKFEYKPQVKSWNTQLETWINNAPVDVHLMKTDVVQADVTGDGLLDIVKSEGSGSNTWKVWKIPGTAGIPQPRYGSIMRRLTQNWIDQIRECWTSPEILFLTSSKQMGLIVTGRPGKSGEIRGAAGIRQRRFGSIMLILIPI
jgi:hypothetical protein